MKTPAQVVQEQMERIKKGMEKFDSPRIREVMQIALCNAEQTLANFQEIERITRNTERLN